MIGINAFEDQLNALIAHTKANRSITHLQDEHGNPASWDSKVWVFTNNSHQTANFYFTRESKAGAKLTYYKNIDPLTSPHRELAMLYALHVMSLKVCVENKRSDVSRARQILASVDSIEDISHQHLETLSNGLSYGYINCVNRFINFLNTSIFQHDPIPKLKNKQNASMTGDEKETNQKEKMPDETCIAAMGAILHATIPPNQTLWKTGPSASQRDAFVCTMSALAMGAPNRAAAEQTVLDAQRLQKHTQKVNDKDEVVHYLDWKGSKGYKNNQNHILSVMSECVERCLDYTLKATEPMRVLSRFYADPTLPLKSILPKKNCDSTRWQKANADLNKPTNMVTLGYLLGLYDEGATIQVTKETVAAYKENPKTPNSAWIKPIWAIRNTDVLQVTITSVGEFIGLKRIGNRPALYKKLGLSGPTLLEKAQASWISHIKTTHPEFPKMRNKTVNGICDARTMLFVFSGFQLETNCGSTIAGLNSKFFPVGPALLGDIFSSEITRTKAKPESIFKRFGFSSEFSILPHQFRHYINHTGFEGGVPKLILNLWSGRKDPTQVLHYIHTSHADQASMVSDIMFNEDTLDIEQAKIEIRLYSLQEYNELTDSVASVTSSGICTQALHITPCEYLNDFDTHCVACDKSCHVAHDEQAIAFLNKDLKHQQQRLEEVADASQFTNSKASQKWYKVHRSHTEMLIQLLALMNDKNIPKGSLIRLLSIQSEFRITDLQTKQVEIKQLCLPNVDKEIAQLINEKSIDDNSNNIVNELLELI